MTSLNILLFHRPYSTDEIEVQHTIHR